MSTDVETHTYMCVTKPHTYMCVTKPYITHTHAYCVHMCMCTHTPQTNKQKININKRKIWAFLVSEVFQMLFICLLTLYLAFILIHYWFYWDSSPGWFWTLGPPSSASKASELQAHSNMPSTAGFVIFFLLQKSRAKPPDSRHPGTVLLSLMLLGRIKLWWKSTSERHASLRTWLCSWRRSLIQ